MSEGTRPLGWAGTGARLPITPQPAGTQGSPQLAATTPARKPPRPAGPSFPGGRGAGTEAAPQQGLRDPSLWGPKTEESSQKLARSQEVKDGSPLISLPPLGTWMVARVVLEQVPAPEAEPPASACFAHFPPPHTRPSQLPIMFLKPPG